MKYPNEFYKPKAQGAPQPLYHHPHKLTRMIHFFPPHNQKIVAKLPQIASKADAVLANLEDGVAIKDKVNARNAIENASKLINHKNTQFWVRVNGYDTPWGLDELITIAKIGNAIDVIMIPKVQNEADIHYYDRIIAQLEAKYNVKKPFALHPIIEMPQAVLKVEEIANASPRIQGFSLGPADLAAARQMKTTKVGGGQPGYGVIEDQKQEGQKRNFYQADIWHYTLGRMIDACRAADIEPFYGPFGDFNDPDACEQQFRNAFLMGCSGTWTLHPSQIDIARKVFAPPKKDVEFARKIIDSIPDGSGVVMVEGKMQDDATVKQAQNIIKMAEMIQEKDSVAL